MRLAPLTLVTLFHLVFLGSTYGKNDKSADVPETLIFDGEALVEAYKQFSANDSISNPALIQLQRTADAALNAGPWSVTSKDTVPPSGDKHDYMSEAPYWWADPEKADGLPYIWRDGERNPNRMQHDSGAKTRMSTNSLTLALAWHYTREKRYAAHAAELLRTWFLRPETRMNPNLNFGQAIRGRNQGRGIGIIETTGMIQVVDAALILEQSDAWTKKDAIALRQWFRSYLEWLQTSKHGKDEHEQENNHGTWYDAQVACFALFTGQHQLARETINTSGRQRIATQISREGKQAHELRRTKSWSYSSFNLQGLFTLAALGRHVDIDLWNYRGEKGGSIRDALAWLTPFATGDREWTYPQIDPIDFTKFSSLLRQASIFYNDPSYEKTRSQITPPQKLSNNQLQLKFPLLPKDPAS